MITEKDMNENNIEDKIQKEDKILKNEQMNNQNEEKRLIKEDIIQTKKEINNNIKIKHSKPFPVKSEIDFKLIKQYKSVLRYDNIKLVSGTILPESNLIIASNIEGKLNIYYYYTGEISKQFSLLHEIKNINPIDKKTIIYSSDYSINTFDVELGKDIWSFYAHDTNINSLYFDEKYKTIISSTKNGIIHSWDFKRKSFIPYISHFLFDENNIISTDYNSENKFFYSLGENGKINILNIFENEEIYKWKLDQNESLPISINANLKNLNQFIVGFENGFKVFDVRNFGCVEKWVDNLNYKIEKCIIDSKNILIQHDYGLILYDYNEKKKIGERQLKDKLGFFSFINYQNNETNVVYGDQQGNVFYSAT